MHHRVFTIAQEIASSHYFRRGYGDCDEAFNSPPTSPASYALLQPNSLSPGLYNSPPGYHLPDATVLQNLRSRPSSRNYSLHLPAQQTNTPAAAPGPTYLCRACHLCYAQVCASTIPAAAPTPRTLPGPFRSRCLTRDAAFHPTPPSAPQ